MTDGWYGRTYRDDLEDRPDEGVLSSPLRWPVRRYDVTALMDFLLDKEGRETRYYGC